MNNYTEIKVKNMFVKGGIKNDKAIELTKLCMNLYNNRGVDPEKMVINILSQVR